MECGLDNQSPGAMLSLLQGQQWQALEFRMSSLRASVHQSPMPMATRHP